MGREIAIRAAVVGLAVVAGAVGVRGGAPVATLGLQQLTVGLERPVYLTHAGDGSGRVFVVEKEGRIRVFVGGQLQGTPFLDIESRVEDSGNEQGLLSVAFHPGYEANRRFFVYYTSSQDDDTIVIAEYRASAGNPNVADTTERVLLRVPHPSFTNHNGGLLKFGPDGYLYAGIGDGGSGGDPMENGQNLGTLLGKILRIDVDGDEPYEIPPDNPFVSTANARDEIYAYGFRNPWRYSFDRQTGRLWAGDVGQGQYEEIDIVERGRNYGWDVMEGFHCFEPSTGCSTAGLELPIFEYSHDGSNGVPGGCSITGGYVYRGSAIPSLRGIYVFADYCTGSGQLFGIREGDGTAMVFGTGGSSEPVTSFGEDEAGELYVVTDSAFGGRGGVFRLVVRGGTCDLACAGDVSATDADEDGSEAVTYDAPTAGGTCGDVTCAPASGSTFPVGTTTVTCTSSEGDGSCSFTVQVLAAGALAVTSVEPSSSPRRTTLTVTISGAGFDAGATVSFGKKIKVRSVTVVSPTELRAEINVKKAKRGPRDVTVTNPGGESATCSGCFTVN
jgi:glucose/arabinose dehydrogenase